MASFAGVDFFKTDDLLSEEERAVRDTVRAWVDDKLVPVIGEPNAHDSSRGSR